MLPASTINEWDLSVLAINFYIRCEVLLQTVVSENESILLSKSAGLKPRLFSV